MATRTVVCPECDEPVPSDRLACPSCGSLLASVAGASRRRRPGRKAAQPAEASATVTAPPSVSAPGPARAERQVRMPLRLRTNDPDDAPIGTAAAFDGDLDDAAEPGPPPASPRAPFREPYRPFDPSVDPDAPDAPIDEDLPLGAPGDVDDAAEPLPPDVERAHAASRGFAGFAPGVPYPQAGAYAQAPAYRQPTAPAHGPVPQSRPYTPVAPAATAASHPAAAPAPAWRPVTPLAKRDWTPPAEPAWPEPGSATVPMPVPIVAPQWAPPQNVLAGYDLGEEHLGPGGAGASMLPSGALAPAAATGRGVAKLGALVRPLASLRLPPALAERLGSLPDELTDDVPASLVAAGGGIATLGFLLPWADVMPGAAAVGGYTDKWGLAAPSNVLPFLVAAALLTLAIMPNQLPARLRTGVVPIAFGGLLLGLVWPFVVGSLGSDLGSMAVAIGAFLLMAGGVLGLAEPRHGADEPSV